VQREEKSLFEQRVALTRSVTPAVASSIRQPFNKVVRNERIRKDIKIAGEGRKQIVEKMIAGFFGSARKKNRGLNYWMKTRFIELEFIDPNSCGMGRAGKQQHTHSPAPVRGERGGSGKFLCGQ
jgi:hypothetical protein